MKKMELNHQDWKPLVLTRKPFAPVKKQPAPSHTAKVANATDVVPLIRVDAVFAKKIVETRVHKQLTRKQLAQLLSIAESILADCETCGVKPSNAIMNKLHNYVNKNHPQIKNSDPQVKR
jgi:ribosome-binding protein aMBF1 (putative translation factor)